MNRFLFLFKLITKRHSQKYTAKIQLELFTLCVIALFFLKENRYNMEYGFQK